MNDGLDDDTLAECANCGAHVYDDLDECPHCGQRLGGIEWLPGPWRRVIVPTIAIAILVIPSLLEW